MGAGRAGEGQTQGSVLGSLTPVPVLTATSLDCPRVWGGHGVRQSRRRVFRLMECKCGGRGKGNAAGRLVRPSI